ncbi:hypothetical protein DVH05_010128 [Phytophthora capsici]|nr:hypothetical protein DVH05_010128 [Phytophthora capsici]
MRLCEGQSSISLMAAEMRAVHEAAFEAFHANGRAANRSVEALCRKIGVDPVPETGAVPLFDIKSMQVTQVSAKYVLGYVFYHDGGRRAPSSVKHGKSIFDEPDEGAPPPVEAVTGQQSQPVAAPLNPLLEPDDESDVVSSKEGATIGDKKQRAARKRARDTDLMDFGLHAHARQRGGDDASTRPTPLRRDLLDGASPRHWGKRSISSVTSSKYGPSGGCERYVFCYGFSFVC